MEYKSKKDLWQGRRVSITKQINKNRRREVQKILSANPDLLCKKGIGDLSKGSLELDYRKSFMLNSDFMSK